MFSVWERNFSEHTVVSQCVRGECSLVMRRHSVPTRETRDAISSIASCTNARLKRGGFWRRWHAAHTISGCTRMQNVELLTPAASKRLQRYCTLRNRIMTRAVFARFTRRCLLAAPAALTYPLKFIIAAWAHDRRVRNENYSTNNSALTVNN